MRVKTWDRNLYGIWTREEDLIIIEHMTRPGITGSKIFSLQIIYGA